MVSPKTWRRVGAWGGAVLFALVAFAALRPAEVENVEWQGPERIQVKISRGGTGAILSVGADLRGLPLAPAEGGALSYLQSGTYSFDVPSGTWAVALLSGLLPDGGWKYETVRSGLSRMQGKNPERVRDVFIRYFAEREGLALYFLGSSPSGGSG